MRRYTPPRRYDFDTEEEYNLSLDAFDREMSFREDFLVEERCERESDF